MKTGEKGLLKFLHPKLRNLLHPINIEAAALWSVAGTATALWLVQDSRMVRRRRSNSVRMLLESLENFRTGTENLSSSIIICWVSPFIFSHNGFFFQTFK